MKNKNITEKTTEQILQEQYMTLVKDVMELQRLVNKLVLIEIGNFQSLFAEQSTIMEKDLKKIEKNLNMTSLNLKIAKENIIKQQKTK